MQAITTIGLDIAKSVFQVHGVDTKGQMWCFAARSSGATFWRSIQKLAPCLVGIEACALGASLVAPTGKRSATPFA